MKTKNFFEKAGDLLICAIALPFLLAFDGVYLGCRFHEAFVTRKKENLALWKSYRKFQKKTRQMASLYLLFYRNISALALFEFCYYSLHRLCC